MLGLVVTLPASAQTMPFYGTTGDSSAYHSVPMYNGMTGVPQYQTGVYGAPFYNNASPMPLPLNQMTAGVNAPSYNYDGAQPYTGFTGGDPMAGMDYANLTSEQRGMIDQQAAARAMQEQAFYANQMAQQGQINGGNQMFGGNQEQEPVRRRVVYKEKNNPLVTPPRLFNPDQ